MRFPVLILVLTPVASFRSGAPFRTRVSHPVALRPIRAAPHASAAEDDARPDQPSEEKGLADDEEAELSQEQKEEIGNLVASDEYLGLSMELTELVRIAIKEELKANLRDFLGKEEYKIGDISKELDARIKSEVAKLRNKEEYELFDLSIALDGIAKAEVERLTGKPYETGDLSALLGEQVKSTVASFTGKDQYVPGDISREIDRRIKDRINSFTGRDTYSFGDLSRELNRRREDWVTNLTGKDPSKYRFGDITRAITSRFLGPRKPRGEEGP